MSWTWAALMPHPPILVPQVGRGRERVAARSLAGAEALLSRIAARPAGGRSDFLLLLSPHQPWAPGALFLNQAPAPAGGLARFGAPEVHFRLTTDLKTASALAAHLTQAGLPVTGAEAPDLTPDHASSVPLYFLSRVLAEPPPVVLANPIGLTPAQAWALGRALANFQPPGLTGALVASGDLSHRLTPEAPAGFHPDGAAFDRDLLAALDSGSAEEALAKWPPRRLAEAGECGFRSALALIGLAGGPVETLAYEGPFGVGYAHAFWAGKA